jgi:hypothetical protein
MKPSRPKSQPDRPWQIPRIEDADIFAIQAIANGTASDAQQQRAYEYVVRALCETDRMTFWPGGEDGKRATDFAEGKRWASGSSGPIDRDWLKVLPANCPRRRVVGWGRGGTAWAKAHERSSKLRSTTMAFPHPTMLSATPAGGRNPQAKPYSFRNE